MRLILTFRPTTSFLVPLDKCLKFSLDALAGKSKGVRPELCSPVRAACAGGRMDRCCVYV